MSESRPNWLKNEPTSALQAVRQAMHHDGDTWLYAWTLQFRTSWRWLHRESRIAQERLDAIDAVAPVTDDELACLCRAWDADIGEVRLTVGDQRS